MRKLLFLAVLFLSSCSKKDIKITQEVNIMQGKVYVYTWVLQNGQIQYSHCSYCGYDAITKTKTTDSIDAINNIPLLKKYNK